MQLKLEEPVLLALHTAESFTWPTQTASQVLLQQNGSFLHTSTAQVLAPLKLHDAASSDGPLAHREWAQQLGVWVFMH